MPTTNGSVYVFNLFSETMTLSTNGGGAGTINDWSTGADTINPKYRPNSIAVARTLNASDNMGMFYNGDNIVTVHWQQQPVTFHLDPSEFPMTQDLLLFIAENTWRLVDQFGTEQASGTLKSGSQPAETAGSGAGR